MTTNQKPYWLATIYLPMIKPTQWLSLVEHFSSIERVFQADAATLTALGLSTSHIEALKQTPWQAVERDLRWSSNDRQHVITWSCPAYPSQLRSIPEPPLVLFVRGSVAVLNEKQIAIIGSRRASPMGLENAAHFAQQLARHGLVVTSGLARGIDGAAHRGALIAQGLTIGVAGTGLLYSYPACHRQLVNDIIEHHGAIVSEFPLETPPHALNFPRRNRIISGLAQGVLVVEAAMRSGTLSTVRHALEQGREVFALPGSIHHPQSRGCHDLIRQGAKLVDSIERILEEFPSLYTPIKQQQHPEYGQKLTNSAAKLLKYIGYESTPVDVIIYRSGLTPGEVSSILLLLELNGSIQSVVGGVMRVAPKRSLG